MNSQLPQPTTYDEFYLRYRLHIGDLTREAKEEMARRGELPGPAPLGYLNHRTGKVETTVIPDPEMAPLVREAFLMAAQGGYSLRQLLAELNRKGLRSRNGKPLQVSGLWYLLTNPFYAGYVRYKGKTFSGVHEPLVGGADFNLVQNRLAGRRKLESASLQLKVLPGCEKGRVMND